MRCFLALPLPAAARTALGKVAGDLEKSWPSLSWVGPGAYHVTLAFLGELDEGGRICASEALATLTEPAIGFRFSGLGGFPPRGPWKVLVASIVDEPDPQVDEPGTPGSGGPGATSALHRRLNEALRARERERGLPPMNPEWPPGKSGRPFTPHVTLARIRHRVGSPPAGRLPAGRLPAGQREGSHASAPGPRDLADMRSRIDSSLAGTWSFDRCVLYSSELMRGGAKYTELDQVMLRPGRG
ncbi:MAG TPA: 2'-5' RNA ligase family protein [Rectinemataceae bacterium]|nr:2'-5' RNA ligase family protein [Rectinemataceae bacterium]